MELNFCSFGIDIRQACCQLNFYELKNTQKEEAMISDSAFIPQATGRYLMFVIPIIFNAGRNIKCLHIVDR